MGCRQPAPLRPAEVIETRRTPSVWGQCAEAGTQTRTQPSSQAPGARRLLRDPQSTHARGSACLLLPRPARRGGGRSRGPYGQAGPSVPFPPPLSRGFRGRVPAGGGARALEQGAAGAAVTSTSTGGEGAGRGQGKRRRRAGGGRSNCGAGQRGRLGRLAPELAASGRRLRSDKYILGARGAAAAARNARTAVRRALSSPAKARRLLLLFPRRGAAESGGLGRRRPGRGADERRRLRARAGLCLASARRPSGAAAPGARGRGR